MEVERQKYVVHAQEGPGGKLTITGESPDGPIQRFEFGAPDDMITAVIGGGYTSHWNPDFLQAEFGQHGTCARFYYDKRVAVDIGDPEDKVSRRKRKILFRNGFGYLCIPGGYSREKASLKKLYHAALDEYLRYEELHPRPAVFQETNIVDAQGMVRKALIPAIDIRVGGGLTGSAEQQERQLRHGQKLTKDEIHQRKLQVKLHRKLRRATQNGTPFRNPFITRTERLYPVQYAS